MSYSLSHVITIIRETTIFTVFYVNSIKSRRAMVTLLGKVKLGLLDMSDKKTP